jgi:murein DD-endopeptidase MepM/ murein hydrolase activator NlpD
MGKTSSKQKRYFTFMLVPHDESNIFSVRISHTILFVLGLVALGLIGSSSYVLTRHLDYQLTKRANVQLAEKNAFFAQELANTHEAFQRVAKMENELRAMLKMQSKNELIKYTGEGGPTMADQVNLMRTLNQKASLTQKEFNQSLTFLKRDAQERLDTYQEMKKYIATQRSVMASRPSSWPVRGWITSRFGMRQSPFQDGSMFHQGIDIANEEGTSVKAPADGVVTYSGWEGGYGKLAIIDHGYGISTRYGHLSRQLVNVGQRVRRGQVIAFLGSTGRSTAPHLHFEVRLNGIPADPLKYLKD